MASLLLLLITIPTGVTVTGVMDFINVSYVQGEPSPVPGQEEGGGQPVMSCEQCCISFQVFLFVLFVGFFLSFACSSPVGGMLFRVSGLIIFIIRTHPPKYVHDITINSGLFIIQYTSAVQHAAKLVRMCRIFTEAPCINSPLHLRERDI